MTSIDPTLKRAWPFLEDEQIIATPPPSLRTTADEEVCLGALVRIKAQPKSLSVNPLYSTPASHPLEVVRSGRFFKIFCDGEDVAHLNKKMSETLYKVVQEYSVRFEAYLSRRKTELDTEHLSCGKPLTIEVNIYSSQNESAKVGAILSNSEDYLQLPRYLPDGFKYENPHMLVIDGFFTNFEVPSLPSDDEDEEIKLENSGDSEDKTEDAEDANDAGEPDKNQPGRHTSRAYQVLDSDLRHGLSNHISVDSRIKSDLFDHQRQAIDFISQREKGETPADEGLWTYNDNDEDEPVYQHILNGEMRRTPDDTKGGILADEMGLGKSLVILSTIAGSLSPARQFGSQQTLSGQSKAYSQATLVVAPSTLLIDNWINEVQRHAYSGSLSTHQHVGVERKKRMEMLFKKDIVFTTYATLATEFGERDSPLSKIEWFRIVLDEAHYIRNRSTKQYKAVASLSAQHKWCLTGTPIQNEVEDLGALISFLKMPVLERPSAFRKIISAKISGKKPHEGFNNLQKVLRAICIRRTRNVANLPAPLDLEPKVLNFTPAERVQYQEILAHYKMRINMVVSGKGRGAVNSKILELFLALRLFCNNGKATEEGNMDADEHLALLQQMDQDLCARCGHRIHLISDELDVNGGTLLDCRHLICHQCMPDHVLEGRKCQSCSKGSRNLADQSQLSANARDLAGGSLYIPDLTRRIYPTKLQQLLFDIMQNPTQKCIVFSSWKKTLVLVGELLSQNHIEYCMIDGSLPLAKRKEQLEAYEKPSKNVLLMTFGTGAVGLNIVAAECIYLLEPQWNPSIEAQAISRAIRLGQESQVTIVRYIMKGTVEDNHVRSRQSVKQRLFNGGFRKETDSSMPVVESTLRDLDFESQYGPFDDFFEGSFDIMDVDGADLMFSEEIASTIS